MKRQVDRGPLSPLTVAAQYIAMSTMSTNHMGPIEALNIPYCLGIGLLHRADRYVPVLPLSRQNTALQHQSRFPVRSLQLLCSWQAKLDFFCLAVASCSQTLF